MSQAHRILDPSVHRSTYCSCRVSLHVARRDCQLHCSRGRCEVSVIASRPSLPINFTCAGHHRSLRCNAIVDQVLGFSFFSRSKPSSIPSYPSPRQSGRSFSLPAHQLCSLAPFTIPSSPPYLWWLQWLARYMHLRTCTSCFMKLPVVERSKLSVVDRLASSRPGLSLVACVRDP